MKKSANDTGRERLYTAVDELTEENQKYVLGVLQALIFAQSAQGQEADQGGGAGANKNEGVFYEQ
jgi:hypothetical protein